MEVRGYGLTVFGIVAAAWVAAGCATDPDIIAMKKADRTDGSILKIGPEQGACKQGRYDGTMSTGKRDGGVAFPFSAQFSFTLVETLSGEFYVLQDTTTLMGTSTDGSMFTAVITGGRACVDGAFSTKLVNGEYTQPKSTMPVAFDGTIDGIYISKYPGFNGQWSTTLHFGVPFGDIPISGGWAAHLVDTAPTN